MAHQSKSLAVPWLYNNFPQGFTESLVPPDDVDQYGEHACIAVVVEDAMTRAYKAGYAKVVAPIGMQMFGEGIDDPELLKEAEAMSNAPKWFSKICRFMLEPGLAAMPRSTQVEGARTFVVAAEGPSYCPAKGRTQVERRYQYRNSIKFSREQRAVIEGTLKWDSEMPMMAKWDVVLADSYLRRIFLHRMAEGFFKNLSEDGQTTLNASGPNSRMVLPINCRVIFDGCIQENIDEIIDEGCRPLTLQRREEIERRKEERKQRGEKEKRYVHVVQGRQEVVYEGGQMAVSDACELRSRKRETSITEGEQAVVGWIRWGCEPVPQEDGTSVERMRSEKTFLVVSNDTDTIPTLLAFVENYLYQPDGGTAESWIVGDCAFKARVLVWIGKKTRQDAVGNTADTDVYVWVTRLWYEIRRRGNWLYTNQLNARWPVASRMPTRPVMNLMAMMLMANNDFSPGMDWIHHGRLMDAWQEYSPWIGDLVHENYEHEPGKIMDLAAFTRAIRAVFFHAYRDKFPAHNHPEEAVPQTINENTTVLTYIRAVVANKWKNATERHVPDDEELAGIALRTEYHIAYNDMAPQDKEEELNSRITEYGYWEWTPEEGQPGHAVIIPCNMKIVQVKEGENVFLRCIKKNKREKKPSDAPKRARAKPGEKKKAAPRKRQTTTRSRSSYAVAPPRQSLLAF